MEKQKRQTLNADKRKVIADIFQQHFEDNSKYKKQHSKWGKNVDEITPNPFDDGILNVKRLENNFVNNIMSFYTRNIFKPFVLTRVAFFTRVFMEEQARIAVKGLSSIYTKPWEYLQWVFAHNPNSKAGKILSKLPGLISFTFDFKVKGLGLVLNNFFIA